MALKISPFHSGEIKCQVRADVREEAESLGQMMIRKFMPDQHRLFYNTLPLMYISILNPTKNQVIASVVSGFPGFIRSPTPTSLIVPRKSFLLGDPINELLRVGAPVGMLGLELHTRRRNRINGIISAINSEEIILIVQQAFGNCPKYIQTRNITIDENKMKLKENVASSTLPVACFQGTELDSKALEIIRNADTFFLATSTGDSLAALDETGKVNGSYGCDISHRGGSPGFVKIDVKSGKTVLKWADFTGNNIFNSLGNIMINPNSGLLFIDWITGAVLQLSGEASINFEDLSLPGAARTVTYTVQHWRYGNNENGVPIFPAPVIEYSPYNPQLEGAKRDVVSLVDRKDESKGIKTFTFSLSAGLKKSIEKKPIFAGQYASFDFEVISDGINKTINRTWTISSSPEYVQNTGNFTISVKKDGLMSSYLHENLMIGDKLSFRGILGTFTPNYEELINLNRKGALLIAGGIGITPMKPMFAEFVKRGISAKIIYSVKEREEIAFYEEFQVFMDNGNSKIGILKDGSYAFEVFYFVTKKLSEKKENNIFEGRINSVMINKLILDFKERDVFLCGPPAFMEGIMNSLVKELSYPKPERIFTESFNF